LNGVFGSVNRGSFGLFQKGELLARPLSGCYAQKAAAAKLQSLGAHRDVQALAAKLDQLAKLGDDDVIKQVTSGMPDHVDVSLGPVLPHLH
jgi:hypothetical protein